MDDDPFTRPWRALVVIGFDEGRPALEFERYLKTGSGRQRRAPFDRAIVDVEKNERGRFGHRTVLELKNRASPRHVGTDDEVVVRDPPGAAVEAAVQTQLGKDI